MRVTARLAAVVLLIGLATPRLLRLSIRRCAARPVVLLARASGLYQLTLDSTRGGRQVTGATGTMGYEVVDVCDGWATRQRLQMNVSNADGNDVDMDSDYATWESKDGLTFRFHMVQKTDSAVTSQTDGSAHLIRTGGPGEAVYRAPKELTTQLPAGTLFPMMHTLAIINAAREGKKFLALPLFDGTDESGVEDSSIAVVDWKPPFGTKYDVLNPLASTRVRIAFFDHTGGASTPTYEAGMRYWENGIADDMLMDFQDFVMHATLTEPGRPFPGSVERRLVWGGRSAPARIPTRSPGEHTSVGGPSLSQEQARGGVGRCRLQTQTLRLLTSWPARPFLRPLPCRLVEPRWRAHLRDRRGSGGPKGV